MNFATVVLGCCWNIDLALVFPNFLEGSPFGLAIQEEIVQELECNVVSVHVPGPVGRQHGRRNRDGNLVIKASAQKAIANQGLVSGLHMIAPIKVKICHVEKSMNQGKVVGFGVGCFGAIGTLSSGALKTTISQLEPAKQ